MTVILIFFGPCLVKELWWTLDTTSPFLDCVPELRSLISLF